MWRRHKPRRRRRETVTRPLIALSSRKWSWLASQCYSSTQAAYEAHSHKDPLELGEAAHRQSLRSARGQFCPLEILASYSDFRASRAGRARDCERALVKNTSLERGQRAEENAETFTSLRHRVRALCVCEVARTKVSAQKRELEGKTPRSKIQKTLRSGWTFPPCRSGGQFPERRAAKKWSPSLIARRAAGASPARLSIPSRRARPIPRRAPR